MKTILTSLLLLLSASWVFAQDPQQDFEQEMLNQLNQLNIINFNPATSTNATQVAQQGNNNISAIDQVNPSAGLANTAVLIQSGNVNVATMNIVGSGNDINAIQDGNSNSYNLDLQGSDIVTNVWQDGNNNDIDQSLSVDGLDYTIIQEGNNNSINQVENDPTQATGLIIRQRGSGMDLVIRNSRF